MLKTGYSMPAEVLQWQEGREKNYVLPATVLFESLATEQHSQITFLLGLTQHRIFLCRTSAYPIASHPYLYR